MIRSFLAAGLAVLSLAPSAAFAADLATPSCVAETYAALAKEQRMFRSVVFGSKKAEKLPVNSLLYDKQGDVWVKTDANSWKMAPGSASAGQNGGLTWSNTQADDQKDTPTRRGLLEARRTTTSDVIPGVTQSLRALECRLRATCEQAVKSQSAKEDEDTVTVQPTGCMEMQVPVLRGCSVTKGVSPAFMDAGLCDEAAGGLFDQETNLLSLTIAYDASYRSLAQFTGMFEGFLSDFRFPLLNPLWQTVRVLGGLKDIPCFLSQCDE